MRTLSAGGSPYAGYAGPAAADTHGPAAAQEVLMNAAKGPEQLASVGGETCLREMTMAVSQRRRRGTETGSSFAILVAHWK